MIEEKLRQLPDKPGVYLFKDEEGQIIYVGKALSLKKRVRSYFQKSSFSPRTESLVSQIHDLEWMVTDSESEAYLLESNLIKHHRPRYNIQLRDDKSYPYIKLTISDPFPQVFLTRNPKQDGSQYFGPYTNVKAARKTLNLIHRLFPLRRCKGKLKVRSRPCLNYHIKECSAPCVGKITREEYSFLVRGVLLFLRGHYKRLLLQLEREMYKASEEEKFERAAKLRDAIRAIQRLSQTQKVSSFPGEDRDLITLAFDGRDACVLVFLIREGKLIDKKHFLLKVSKKDSGKDILNSFIKEYYSRSSFIPPRILLQYEIDEPASIARWLSEKREGEVKLEVPHRGEKMKLMRLAEENARLILEQERFKDKEKALSQLKEYLELKEKPLRIEGFDISNIRGKEAVGSMVVFEEGKAKKDEYRRFKIKTVEGIDDFAMLSEVVDRRYQRLLKEKKVLPHLILVDGGKGQLSSCLKVLEKLNLGHIPIIGLAKRFEEVYLPHRSSPLRIREDSAALRLLQEIRDEAHRFAHSYHGRSYAKKLRCSSLDEIPGVGAKTKRLLLSYFKSLNEIKKKSAEELEIVPGIGRKRAEKILEYLRENA